MRIFIIFLLCFFANALAYAQSIRGRVFDADTKEPLADATIIVAGKVVATTTANGQFLLDSIPALLTVTLTGYQDYLFQVQGTTADVALVRSINQLTEVVISANRDAVKRTQAPIAISNINARVINDTKATTIDQLVNKTSGVYMVNLGNEQHSMAIRQPMSTRATYLYLEDGIPIRTSGVFNHNALMEINMPAVKNIEVVKGPSSSLYGGEAIGGAINFITNGGTAIPQMRLSAQGNNLGYLRADVQSGFVSGKWSGNVSGYYAQRRNGFIEYSDFNKAIITARADYKINAKARIENSFTYMDYYSDMSGGVDSAMFANKSFKSQHTFTGRNVKVARYRTSFISDWNQNSRTTVHAVYRFNELDMNASFRVRDDYNRVTRQGNKQLAHSEISLNRFNSYVLIGQHRQKFNFWDASIVAGGTADISPNTQKANYIRVTKDTLTNKYVSFVNRPDSLLTYYKNDILNYAGFLNVELSPVKNLRVVAALRYDVFRYQFDNFLPPSAFSGSADTTTTFGAFSPKVGFTYNFGGNRGIYANYSRGFVPPQVGELFRGVKVPNLSPAIYDNYEAGGWAEIVKEKVTADISFYRLVASNSIISIRFDDGSFGNANAGGTLSRGIEAGININPFQDVSVRISGAYSKHSFTDYEENGVKFNENEMPNAPRWVSNAELTYKPSYLPGLRLLVEWQKMGSYWQDAANTAKYNGFNVVNARIGYQIKQVELWLNVINVLDAYYAVNSSLSRFGANYTVAEPQNFNLGIGYDFGRLIKRKK